MSEHPEDAADLPTGTADGERIGYGQPPKHSRFKPGTSGNPKGRPKVPKSLGAAVDSFLSEKITVTEQGRIQKIAKRDVIAKQLVNKAASGDLAAIRFLTQVLEANAVAKAKQAAGSEISTINETDDAVIAALVQRFGGPSL
ncbi:MAG: DUF5681 domain-containing protein [Pseudomonadota bacterium]|nr:DUF5681 domain-containing protein [Pseudomonadota bacterium]